MCVIFIADDVRPTEEMVAKAYQRNPVGGGIAWREQVKGETVVRWAKGLELEPLQNLVKKVPMPFIMHCRKDTCGGEGKDMTHPFHVSTDSPLDLTGRTKGHLLFHNGHYNRWKDMLLETVIKANKPMPKGRWTDTRAMAFIAGVYGPNTCELFDEKIAIMSPDDIEVFGTGWMRVNGVVVSNKLWEYEHVRVTSKSDEGKAGGTSHQASFRRNDEAVQREEDKSKSVEAGKETVRAGHEGNKEEAFLTQEDRDDAIEWVRSLNPTRFRAHLPDDVERDRRIDNARLGITHIGKL